jgi:CHRD domain
MTRLKLALAVAVAVTLGATAAIAGGGGDIRERLTGYEETPLAISTPGKAKFEADVDKRRQAIDYRLSYGGMESAVRQAHIHFGAVGQSGGISVFLCSNMGNGPAGTQACPAQPATITGTIRPGDVIGPDSQGIAAGEFGELLDAIRAGATYVNVHTMGRAAGEVRAQIDDDHDD